MEDFIKSLIVTILQLCLLIFGVWYAYIGNYSSGITIALFNAFFLPLGIFQTIDIYKNQIS